MKLRLLRWKRQEGLIEPYNESNLSVQYLFAKCGLRQFLACCLWLVDMALLIHLQDILLV